jgi:hypothetical protein
MKGVVAAAAFALASTAPFSAHAVCVQAGTAVSHFQFPGAASFIVAPNSFDGIFYFCSVFDPQLNAAAVAAASNRNRVVVQGDIASCPTTGQPFRFMGNCSSILLNP